MYTGGGIDLYMGKQILVALEFWLIHFGVGIFVVGVLLVSWPK